MTWFTIFTTLLAVQFTVGISDVEMIFAELGRSATLTSQTSNSIDKCECETNTGQNCTTFYTNSFRTLSLQSCSTIISEVKLEDAGEWKITMFFPTDDPPVTQKFKLYVTQNVPVVPDVPTISEGYFAYVQFDMDKKNVTNCTLSIDNGRMWETEIDLLNEHTENFQRFGQCGVRILGNSSIANKILDLKAIVEDKFSYFGYISINVINTEVPDEMQVITLERGQRDKVSLSTGSRTTFCQLEGPMGLKTPFYESCAYTIPVVTSRHDGVWIARYGVRESPVPIIQRFRVVVRDAVSTDTNVAVTENNEIQLSCHVYDKTGLVPQFCHFTRPDGYVLNLAPGIGTESYSAFNVSKLNNWKNANIYCGLIIHQPKQYDYGGWKCGIGSRYKFYEGSIIYVDPRIINANETRDREIKVVAENVYVKGNDSFQIKCTADAVLSYCWFRSPNGTSYSVSKMQKQSPTILPYVGLGLNLGECVVQVDHATYTDHGEWTCNVGVLDGPEKSEKFFVNVTESYVIAEHSALMINYEDNITLSCNILPNLTDKEIRYCRWIHPDGHGIHNGLSHRYMTNQTGTQCRLMIPNKYSEESVGRWTCVAGLYGLEDEESWATITVYSQSTTYLPTIITIIVTLLLITLLCVSGCVYVRRKRRTSSEVPSPCNSDEKTDLQQFFVKVHPEIGNCNKSLSRKSLE